jgi:large subunit ribosomal protein L11
MAKQTINALVQGGKANAGPPLGPALGPTGLNIGDVISEINEKTKEYAGIDIPIKVIVDGKEFEIEVGSPPVSALIKKELKIEKGSGTKDTVAGDITLEQVIKIAKMKKDSLKSKDLKNASLQILGTCKSMNVTCEGKTVIEINKEIKEGAHDARFKE